MNDILQNSISYVKTAKAGFTELKNFRFSYFGKVFSLMGKKEKIAFLLLSLLALASLFFSVKNFYYKHTTPTPAFGGTYTEGIVGQPVYINPILAHTEADLSLVRLVFSSLYKYGPNGEQIPDLAEGFPQISQDQKEYTINLKKDAKWHNGRSLTADDVVFTIQTIKNPEFKSPLRNMWLSTNVEKLSDYSVKFKTKDVSGPFFQNLTVPVISKFLWNKVDPQKFVLSPQNLKAVGSGPYSLKEIQSSDGKVQKITLVSFGQYYSERAKIENLNFIFYDNQEDTQNALQGKEIDGLGASFGQQEKVLEKNNIIANTVHQNQYETVFFNTNGKIFNDTTLRQAFTSAVNAQELTEKVFGKYAFAPRSPFAFADTNNLSGNFLTANIETSKTLLDKAGWKLDEKTGQRMKKNTPLEIAITASDSALQTKTAEELKKTWESLGIKIALNILPIKTLQDTVIGPRNFDILIIPLKIGADPDPFFFWHSSQAKDPGLNLSGFESAAADKLISEARTTTDKKIRADKYAELDKLISAQFPAIFLNQSAYIYSLDKKVKNFSQQILFEPSMRMYNIPNWYIETKRVWGK
jgi:peptide/nickel transport system substrate-binding protein